VQQLPVQVFVRGPTGLHDTLTALDAAGLPHVGAGLDLEASFEPAALDSRGLRVAFLGIACTLPGGFAAGPDRPGVAPIRIFSRLVIDAVSMDENPGMSPYVETVPMPGDVERAAEAVGRARSDADVVVVGIHWGVPNGWAAQTQDELATYQRPLGHALVDAGADAVIGHHPHALHGVELYRGRPIFYSLGNFLFHSLLAADPQLSRSYPPYRWTSLRSEVNHHGGVAKLTWSAAGEPVQVELRPVWLDEAGEPCLPDEHQARFAVEHVARLSSGLGASVEARDGELGVTCVIKEVSV